MNRETWELLSYVVTVVGLPLAIVVFIIEQRRERNNEEAEIYQRLTDDYTKFMQLVLENADLRLFTKGVAIDLTPEQQERKYTLFNILIAIFERAYILVYEERMNSRTQRLWSSWEDFMREWCRRPDFRAALAELLRGEDAEFAATITRIAAQEAPASLNPERAIPRDAPPSR